MKFRLLPQSIRCNSQTVKDSGEQFKQQFASQFHDSLAQIAEQINEEVVTLFSVHLTS
jgi:hypothetical protein